MVYLLGRKCVKVIVIFITFLYDKILWVKIKNKKNNWTKFWGIGTKNDKKENKIIIMIPNIEYSSDIGVANWNFYERNISKFHDLSEVIGILHIVLSLY